MSLMDSVGVKGSVANYEINYDVLKHLYERFYHKNEGIRDLSNKFVAQRRELFTPFYKGVWDKSVW